MKAETAADIGQDSQPLRELAYDALYKPEGMAWLSDHWEELRGIWSTNLTKLFTLLTRHYVEHGAAPTLGDLDKYVDDVGRDPAERFVNGLKNLDREGEDVSIPLLHKRMADNARRLWIQKHLTSDLSHNLNGGIDKTWTKLKEMPDFSSGILVPKHKTGETMKKEFPPPRWAITNLLPMGLTILASAPKIGKSWLALNIALAIARGHFAMNEEKVEQGDVLFIDLEENEESYQSRVKTLLPKNKSVDELEESLNHLEHVHTWDYPRANPSMDAGSYEDLKGWLIAHPNRRLVVIDIWTKFRPSRKKGANLYDEDYSHLSQLQVLAQAYNVAILVIHHTRKEASADPLGEISGSHGITGAADCTWVLKRERLSGETTLFITGRNVKEESYSLAFSEGKWNLLGKKLEVEEQTSTYRIMRLFTAEKSVWTTKEVQEELVEMKAPAVKMALHRLHKSGALVKKGTAQWTTPSFAKAPVTR